MAIMACFVVFVGVLIFIISKFVVAVYVGVFSFVDEYFRVLNKKIIN